MLRLMVKCAAVAALCACTIVPVIAKNIAPAKQARVNLRDMDLRKKRDVETVRRRIDDAVAYVCDVPRRSVFVGSNDGCVDGALRNANDQFDAALSQARRHLAIREQWSSAGNER